MANTFCSRLENTARERMRHLRCICFVRPSSDSIQYLIDEFREPRYGEYALCEYRLVEELFLGRLLRNFTSF